jgi:sensor domain CHASE-containing protein
VDYAHWDDTYNFIQDKNLNYINNNFPDDSTIENLDIDFMVFINKKNDVIFSTFLNRFKEDEKDSILDKLLNINKKNSEEIILAVENDIYFISKAQIKKSDESGENQGLIISGAKIKEEDLNTLFNKKIMINNDAHHDSKKDIDLSNQNFKKVYADISFSNKQIINHIHFLSKEDSNLMTIAYIENRDIYLEGKKQIYNVYNIC